MTGRTHDLAAFTALNYLFVTQPLVHTSLATTFVAAGANLIGGLTADIDQPTAAIWNRLPAGSIIGRILSPILGSHRMISHSFVGIGAFGLISHLLFVKINSILLVDMNIVWIAFMTGFISHLAMDIFTKEGIPLFFPLPFKIGFPPFKALRFETGGLVEKSIIFPGLLLLNGYLIYTRYKKYLEFLQLYIK